MRLRAIVNHSYHGGDQIVVESDRVVEPASDVVFHIKQELARHKAEFVVYYADESNQSMTLMLTRGKLKIRIGRETIAKDKLTREPKIMLAAFPEETKFTVLMNKTDYYSFFAGNTQQRDLIALSVAAHVQDAQGRPPLF